MTYPEISTIHYAEQLHGRGQREHFSEQVTPKQPRESELTAVTPLDCSDTDVSAIEMSQSTLMAPPNSINSQFISGKVFVLFPYI